MKPAGALFPFDVAEDRILLSWEGGVDAALYRELARAGGGNGTGTPRHPQYFNWPRFREVLAEGREGSEPDLWRMDWPLIAEKTARSGFDRRRLTVAEREPVSLPLGYAGFWVSASPFAEPVYQDDGADLALNLCDAIETYVSSMGILRCSKTAWVLTPRSRQ
jgi:hypothetical protein